MADVIDAHYEIRWQEPVWVRIGYGFPEAVRGPKQALTYLTFRWPTIRGDRFKEAMHRCNLALRKELGCEAARAAFVSAAREADMMAGPKGPQRPPHIDLEGPTGPVNG